MLILEAYDCTVFVKLFEMHLLRCMAIAFLKISSSICSRRLHVILNNSCLFFKFILKWIVTNALTNNFMVYLFNRSQIFVKFCQKLFYFYCNKIFFLNLLQKSWFLKISLKGKFFYFCSKSSIFVSFFKNLQHHLLRPNLMQICSCQLPLLKTNCEKLA